jgi:methyl-accepting chemotaxis protein
MKPVFAMFRTRRSVYMTCVMITACVSFLVAGLLSVANYTLTNRLISQNVAELGRSNTVSAAINLAGAVRFKNTEQMESVVEVLIASSGDAISGLAVLNASGDTLISRGTLAAPEMGAIVKEAKAMLAPIDIDGSTEKAILQDSLDVAVPILVKDTVVGSIAVRWNDQPALDAVNQERNLVLAVSVGALCLLLLLTGSLLKRMIGKPLDRLNGAVLQVASGDLDTTTEVGNTDNEFSDLAVSLEKMRVSLCEAKRQSEIKVEETKQSEYVIEEVSAAMRSLASGNLEMRLNSEFPSKYETLRRNFNESVAALNDTLRAVIDCSLQIERASGSIGQSTDNLSRRTENQAASLEETAAGLDEMTASIKGIAADAQKVDSIVALAKSEATSGGSIVQKSVAAMSEINQSSQKITSIIDVIEDISFQTNLLALNAGVEAARAGEFGRGFAVVASEVRGLAQRSTVAAQ